MGKKSLSNAISTGLGKVVKKLTGVGSGKIGSKIEKNLSKSRKVGGIAGSTAGGAIGEYAGKHLKNLTGIGAEEGKRIGQRIGGNLGKLLPFKLGGKINKDGPIYAHHGEFVLPAGVHPDSHQIKIVKNKGGMKKKERLTAKEAYLNSDKTSKFMKATAR